MSKIFHRRPSGLQLSPQTTASNGDPNLSSRALMARAHRRASLLTERTKWADNFGSHQFDGLRNMYRVLGYPDPERRDIQTADYFARYERGDIAAKIIEFFPKATWDNSIRIVEDKNNPEATGWDIEIEALWKKFDIWGVLTRADIMSGIGKDGWSVILIGSDDSTDFSTKMETPGNILYLVPYSQMSASYSSNDVGSANDERFGLPTVYTVKGLGGTGKVHWSRTFHTVNNPFDSRATGPPTLKRIYNKLMDLDKLVGGGSEAAWRNMNSLKLFDFDPESRVSITDDAYDDFKDEIDDVIHGFKDYGITQGAKPNVISTQVHNFKSNMDAVLSIISGSVGIPQRNLVGSERGELASSQDTTNVNARIRERQEEKVFPTVSEMVNKFMDMGALSRVSDFDIILPTVETVTDTERSAIVGSYAAANKAQVDATGEPIISAEEIRQDVLDKDPLDDDNIVVNASRSAADLADEEPDEPDWKAVHRVADRHVNGLTKDIDEIFVLAANEISALNTAEDEAMSAITDAFNSLMPDRILEIENDAGREVLDVSIQRGSFFRSGSVRRSQFEFSFDDENPSAVQWALTRSSDLITEISPDTRSGIQLIIAEGQARNFTPTQVISHVRQSVGLRSDQVQALYGFVDRLDAAEAGDRVFMGVRQGQEVWITIPRMGANATFIAKQRGRYSGILRTARSRLIARRETLFAANQGQKELWYQAINAGELNVSVNRVWISTPDDRVRDTHASWNGSVTGVNEPFEFGVEPGEEPNCRCGQGLVN